MRTHNNLIATLLMMSDAAWRRHANPWSVWTRIVTCLPLLTVALWSRDWIGPWSVVPIVAALVWIWINPRIFPETVSTDNWASFGVFGERVWLNRKAVPIPRHHVIAATVLLALGAVGILPYAYGLWCLSLWPTLFGGALMYMGKLWFFDRMVWLFRDMKDTVPEYAAWVR